MLVQQLRKRIYLRLRSEAISKQMSQIRSAMLQKAGKNDSVEQNESKLLNHMQRYILDSQYLNSSQILCYIEINSYFSKQFQNKLSQIVLKYLSREEKCLRSLTIMLKKCGSNQQMQKVNMDQLISLLMTNLKENSEIYIQVVFDLILTLFQMAPKKQVFQSLSKHESNLFLAGINPIALKIFVQLGFANIISPSNQCIQHFIAVSSENKNIPKQYFEDVSKLIFLFLINNEHSKEEQKYKTWLEQNITIEQFTLSIWKIIFDLLMELSQQDKFGKAQCNNIFQRLSLKMNFWSFKNHSGLEIIIIVLESLPHSQRIELIQKQKLVEKAVLTLNAELSNEDIFRLLSILIFCFEVNERYLQEALSLGFHHILTGLQDSQNKQVGQTVDLIYKCWDSNSMI